MRRALPLLCALFAAGCSPPQPQEAATPATTSPAAQPQLTVAAAASLREVVTELAHEYETQRPGVSVRVTAAGSGALLQQLKQGAPIDLLITADSATMAQANEAGLIQEPPVPFAYNRLVVIAPTAPSGAPEQGQDRQAALDWLLTLPKVACGQPDSVPAGRYAQQALENQKVWEALQPKLVYGQSVRQVLDWVARGEADAGFVYATDAQLMPQRVRVVTDLPTPQPVRYEAAVTQEAGAGSGELLDFLQGPEAQAALERAGFLTRPPTP